MLTSVRESLSCETIAGHYELVVTDAQSGGGHLKAARALAAVLEPLLPRHRHRRLHIAHRRVALHMRVDLK